MDCVEIFNLAPSIPVASFPASISAWIFLVPQPSRSPASRGETQSLSLSSILFGFIVLDCCSESSNRQNVSLRDAGLSFELGHEVWFGTSEMVKLSAETRLEKARLVFRGEPRDPGF